MRQAATRRPLLTGLALGVIASAVWWIATNLGDGPRVEPASEAAAREDAGRGRNGDAPTTGELPAPVVAADRSLDTDRTRTATRTLLRGFVVDRTGQRVSGAQLQWSEVPGAPFDYKRHLTAPAGEYALPGLPAAVVRFHVTGTGLASLDLALDLSKGGALRHDFVVDRSVLVATHVQTPDGKSIQGEPMANAKWDSAYGSLAIIATETPIAALAPISTRNYEERGVGVGQFHRAASYRRQDAVEIPAGAFGVLELPRLPLEATLLFKHVVVDHQRLEPGATSVTFTFDPAQIDRFTSVLRVTLVDAASGDAIEDARVSVYDSQTGGQGEKAASDGTYERRRIPPGWMGVTIAAPDHARWYRNLLFEPGATLDLGELELPAALTLSGTVVDSDGKPAMASLEAWPLAGYVPGQPFGESFSWGMEKAGEWRIAQLGPGRCQLQSFGENNGSGTSVQCSWSVVDVSESTSPVALTLRSTVKVVLDGSFATASDAKPESPEGHLDDCVVDVVRADGFVATAGRRAWRAPVELQLLAGSYVCAVRRRSQLVRSVPFEVAEQPLRVAFRLDDGDPPVITPLEPTAAVVAAVADVVAQPPTASTKDALGLALQGRIVDQTDAVVDGARVSATDTAGASSYGVVAADGAFVIAGLQPGRHELQGSADGCRPAHAVVELAADGEPAAPKLVLRRMTRLAVSFEQPDGQPLAAAYERRFVGSQFENDVTVVVSRAPPPDPWPRSSFSLGWWKPEWSKSGGTLDLREPPPLHAAVLLARRVIASRAIEPGATELRFVIDPARFDEQLATLRFCLIDAITGEPIPRAFVGLCGLNGAMRGDPSSQPEQLDGVHVLEGQQPGRRQLCISRSRGASTQLVVELEAGSTLDLGDIELLDPVELRGIVVDESGAPLKTAVRVIGYDTTGEPQLEGSYYTSESDDAGRFTFQASRPWIRLQVRRDGLPTAWSRIDVAKAAADGAEIRLVLRRGQQVTLQPSPGDDVLRRVVVRTADGELLNRLALDGAAPNRFPLLPGDYRVVVERDGADAKEIAFSVGDSPVTVELP